MGSYLILLNRRIRDHAYVIMHIEVEQGTRLAPCLINYKVVKSVMLNNDNMSFGKVKELRKRTCGMIKSSYKCSQPLAPFKRDLTHLDIHEVVYADTPELGKLLSALFQECTNIIALLALGHRALAVARLKLNRETHCNALSVATSVPIRVNDLDIFFLRFFLSLQPLLPELFTSLAFGLFTFPVWQE